MEDLARHVPLGGQADRGGPGATQGAAAGQVGKVAARRLDGSPTQAMRRRGVLLSLIVAGAAVAQPACDKPVYLTFDTGHMGVAP